MPKESVMFKLRGLWIGLVFWVGFWLYFADRRNAIDGASRFAEHKWHAGKATTAALMAVMGICVTLAPVVRTWASAYLSASVVHDARLHSERLVADGPYRYTRNPLYLGTLLLAFAFGLMASRTGFVVIVAGISLITWLLVRTEEAGLLASQGERFQKYMAAVPRLWPSLRPQVARGGARPDWANGFRGELYMWLFAAGTDAFAITHKLLLFYAGLITGVVVLIIEGITASKQRPAADVAQK